MRGTPHFRETCLLCEYHSITSSGRSRADRGELHAADFGRSMACRGAVDGWWIGRRKSWTREFAEAWCNLAELLGDQGRSEAAVECLRKPLLVAPDYIDAMFNLALLLQRKGAYEEAADYWLRYSGNDRASEWAARARRSLKFCEIQVNSLCRPRPQTDSDQAA
jgi:tetratricopeptide (TPR) repeat protein